MPVYEYLCTTCDTVFEEQRPMSESGESATCPEGHRGAERILSAFASVGRSAEPVRACGSPMSEAPCGGGACAMAG